MEITKHVSAGPKVPDLPELPSDFWTPTQWGVFLSLADAVLAPVVPQSELEDKAVQMRMPDDQFSQLLDVFDAALARPRDGDAAKGADLARAVLKDSFSTNPALTGHLRRSISATVHHRLRKIMGLLLTVLSTRVGAFVLTGNCTPVHLQPLHVREAVLRRWTVSYVPAMRLMARSIATLAQYSWLQSSPLFKQASGYTDVPHPWKPGPAFEFEFLQFPPATGKRDEESGSDPVVVETDVVIVGSGCGGAVCAKILAEAGHRVLVLEKGHYYPPSQLPMPQEQGSRLLFENGGVVATTDGALTVVAGATWGGGGTINWSVCLQTQDPVRREWARDRGLPFFETPEFQACLDRVCDYMGATAGSEADVRQTHRGKALLDGCDKLGWRAAALMQNSGGAEHWCGRCTMGCHGGEKQGPAVSWLA
ncbi:long chain fatty acid oxidase, partial [Magnaporthiopsis poae ATCC 64411]